MRWNWPILNSALDGRSKTGIDVFEQAELSAISPELAHESKDEIGRVALHLDHLLDQIQERDARLRRWNEELNQRVEGRTLELQQANRRLERTTQQLIMSEKLAAIGEITAGVAHEVMRKIFDSFFTTKGREGTGLGLSISQMLVTRQGGKISVDSEPGKGTTFAVWLPESH